MTRRAIVRWWLDLPIRYKGLLVVVLPLVTLATAIFIRIPFTRMQEETTVLLGRAAETRDIGQTLMISLLDVETGTRGFALTHQRSFLEPFEKGQVAVQASLKDLARLSVTPEEQRQSSEMSVLVRHHLEIASALISLAGADTASVNPAIQQHLVETRWTMDAIRVSLGALRRIQDVRVATSQVEAARLQRWLRPFVLLTLILGIIGALPAVWLFATGIAQRVKALERNAERLARGKRLRREPSRGADEIGSLDLTLRRASLLLRTRDRELRAVNRELEAFSYSVSHDLRAPLRSIDGFAQALREDWGDRLDETGQNHLARVRNAAQRMGRLIDDLLKLAKLTRAQIQRAEVDLSQLARDIANELEERNPTRDVSWAIDEGLHAWCDSALARILLENLLGNAWKFTSKTPGARIEFLALPESDPRVFVVRDNGAGFDMRYVEKLFSPFQRLHGEREFPGTGIGLATVQRIVHKHGGEVQTAADVGKGATFSFTLAPGSEAMAVA